MSGISGKEGGGDRFKVPSAHEIRRLGEVSRVKGMCHVRQRHMASETLSKNNQDPAFSLLSSFPATRPHYSSPAGL